MQSAWHIVLSLLAAISITDGAMLWEIKCDSQILEKIWEKKQRVPLYLTLHKGLSWLLWLKYPSSLSGEYLDVFAGKPRDNFNASPGIKKENFWVSAPLAASDLPGMLEILHISSVQTPWRWVVPHPWWDWKAQRRLTMNSRQRAMGLKALIQTEPLSLLGCCKEQQGWTWSDGAVPAKHFGTCRDMKGSNETHFTIHWPRALSRQSFLPNSPQYILWPRSAIGFPSTH